MGLPIPLPILRHTTSSRRFSRAFTISCSLVAIVTFFILFTSPQSRPRFSEYRFPSQESANALHKSLPAHESAAELARALGLVFDSFPPTGPKETDWPEWKRQNAIFQQRWNGSETAGLWDTIQLDASKLLRVKEAHEGFLQATSQRLPQYIAPSDTKGRTKGIVTVGGGGYFPPLLVSLRLLRRTGTTLPVEVFVPEEDYEADLCESALASLGATCRVFPDIPPLKLNTFQFKVFAILFSSFDEVLLLDADDFPIHNVEPLFSSRPYKDTGLVTWPDFWSTAVSPLYYLVSSQEPMAISQRPKSETGQLLVHKALHWRTLLLAAYYNYYPDVYYPLLCQGCIGCGDSETILPAADAMNLPYYYVKTPPMHVGHKLRDGGIQGHVIVQFNPITEFSDVSKIVEEGTTGDGDTFSTIEGRRALHPHAEPLFMHASFPKWDPYKLLDHISQWSDMTLDIHGNPAAAFQDTTDDVSKIRGVERMAWEEARWAVCNLGAKVGHWNKNGKTAPATICQRLNDYFRDVLDKEVGAKLGLGPNDVLAPSR